MSRRLASRLAPAFAVAVVGALAALPALIYGLPAVGDSVYHASWYRNFAAQFWAGELYPRWLAGMNAGLGSPTFFFYAPVPFHIASLLKPLLPADAYGLRNLGAECWLAIVASGLAAYVWLKKVCDSRAAAAIGASLYVLAPYHLVIDLYNREAYTELWAFVWMPLVLRGIKTIGDERRATFAALAVAYALLAATHLPATLIFSPVAIAYAYFTTERAARNATTVRALAGVLVGAGLASVYLVPALFTQGDVTFADMHAFNYFERWVTFTRASARDLYGQALWGALTSACIIVCAAVNTFARASETESERREIESVRSETESARSVSKSVRREIVFWIVAAAGSVLMMSFASAPVWSVLKALQKVQFPWRFSLNLCPALAATVAVSCAASLRARKVNARMLVFASLSVVAWLAIATDVIMRDYARAFATGAVSITNTEARLFRLGRDAPEYKPAQAASNSDDATEEIVRRLCDAETVPAGGCVSVAEGEATATVERWRARAIDLRVATHAGAQITVAQFYYPVWTARLDGAQQLPVQLVQPAGLLSINAPAGEHTINLRLEPTHAETLGRVVSALTLALLMLYLAQAARVRRVPREKVSG